MLTSDTFAREHTFWHTPGRPTDVKGKQLLYQYLCYTISGHYCEATYVNKTIFLYAYYTHLFV